MAKAAIIGVGKLGSAIAGCLRRNAEVWSWDKDPAKSSDKTTVAETVLDADAIFFCVPSWALRDAAKQAYAYAGTRTVIVCVSKGLEHGTGAGAEQIVRTIFSSKQPFVFLGGAMLSAEIVEEQGAAAVVASRQKSAHALLAALLHRSDIRIEHTDDVTGVVMTGVLKNIYALGMGIADGLDWGDNKKGWLAAAATGEMCRLLPIFGGKRDTAFGTAGLGDLLATGLSQHSTHRRAGRLLATSSAAPQKCEGVISAPSVMRAVGKRAAGFPLLTAIASAASGKERPRRIFERLFSRSL